jgi:6-phosphogluconolactonase
MMLLFQPRQSLGLAMVLCGTGIYAAAAAPAPGLERFYIGTYTSGTSVGIYQSSLNLGAGTFAATNLAVTTGNPSFLALTPNRKFLYAVNEGASNVVAFSVNPATGGLTLLNSQSSDGTTPCHVVVDSSGRNVIVANYGGGSVTVYPIQTNGQLGAATAHVQHPGTKPHAHCTTIDASNHFAFVCDLGLNQIRSYVFDPGLGTLTTNTILITAVAAGSGPRHMTFDPQCKRAYVICETSSTIIGFNYNATNGTLNAFQTVSTLPPGWSGANTTAEIAVHPSGEYIYGSNRGYNSIVVFTVNPADGNLTQVQQQATGTTPRHFAIDPTGAFCVVASQNSDSIVLYAINFQTGQLTSTGQGLSVSKPVCILPFILQPPQPVLTTSPTTTNTVLLSIGNGLDLLTYQLYQRPALSSGATWDLLTTGNCGQTNFVLSKTLAQNFFRVGVLTNY